MEKESWVYCPICGSKTRITIRRDTIARNLPVFCPKCKAKSLVDIEKNKIIVQ